MRFGTDKACAYWDKDCWAVAKAAAPGSKRPWLNASWYYTEIENAAAKVVELTALAGGDVDGLWDAVAEMRRIKDELMAEVRALNIVPS